MTEEKDVNYMFIIIILHKWNEAYQMGLSLKSGGVNLKKAIFYVVFYSLLTPIGILVGKEVEKLCKENHRIYGILMSLSVGIFLYISIGEIILEEFVVSKHKFWKFGALLIGVFFVYFMTYIAPDHTH
jgi:zinc transporter ZupT